MFILGIDVGKSELHCRLLKVTDQGASKLGAIQVFSNSQDGQKRLKQWLEGHQALGDMPMQSWKPPGSILSVSRTSFTPQDAESVWSTQPKSIFLRGAISDEEKRIRWMQSSLPSMP